MGICFGQGDILLVEGVKKEVLENGFGIIFKEAKSHPVVAFQLWVKVGSVNEEEKEAGITHLIEHMIFKGTERFPKGEIAKRIEAKGGHINAYTSFEHTVYHVEVPKWGAKEALEILLDAVFNPLFDPAELELEREVVLEEFRRSLDRPETRLSWDFLTLVFPDHPYGRPIIGSEASIKGITRDMVLKYVSKWYRPNNSFLVAVGDVEMDMIKSVVEGFLKDKPFSKDVETLNSSPVAIKGSKLSLKEQDVSQIYLQLGWPTPAITHPDTPHMELLEVLLGQGRSSRLQEALRIKNRLANSISVGNMALKDAGVFTLFATAESADVTRLLEEIKAQMEAIGNGTISEQELEMAKNKMRLNTLSEVETSSGIARTLGFFEAYFKDYRRFQDYMESIKNAKAEDLRRVANTYLSMERAKGAVLSKTGALREEDLRAILKTRDVGISKIKAHSFRLRNGMRVVMEERQDLPIVSMVVALPGGLRSEEKDTNGISQVVSRMLLRGTKGKDADELMKAIEIYGATVDTFSGKNSLGLTMRCLSKDFQQILPLVKEILLEPSFPQGELAKVKQDFLNAIKAKKDKPFQLASELLFSTVFLKHPYAMPESGTEESLNKISRDKLIDWYQGLIRPDEMVISVVGMLKAEELRKLMESSFGDIKARPRDLKVLPEAPLKGLRIAHLEKQIYQTHLMFGFLDLPNNDPEVPAMMLLNAVLSRQGGRLFRILRDEKGLAYVVSSFRVTGPETGLFAIYMACEPNKVETAREGVMGILKDVIEKGVSEEELTEAKSYVLGSMEIDEQSSGHKALKMALDELLGLGYDYEEVLKERIRGIKGQDIKSVANRVLNKPYAFITVGPKAN